MFNAARQFEEAIYADVRAAGFPEIRFVHLTLTRNMDSGGTRLTQLAARAGMTKQAMSELVDQCEAIDIVERRPDPSDRRARIIVFTSRGHKLLRALIAGIARAEADMRAAIGAETFKIVAAALRLYCVAETQRKIA
jgi:DNA-binding MarR family transcriptional regulator